MSVILLLAAAGCGGDSGSPPETSTPVPRHAYNVLLITVDTLRADYLGCYGKEDISTPVIDRLAARGVRFTQAVAQVPLTTPSHASILTGTYPTLHKIRDVGGFVLDPQVSTLAEELRAAGYATAAFVSAAVLDRHYQLDRGFEVYNDDMAETEAGGKLPGVVAEVRGEVVTRRALEWLEGRLRGGPTEQKPFLLWLHFYDPHFPYDPPEPFRRSYARDPYAGEVAYTDEQIGRVLTFLDAKGAASETLVVLLSDHGESLGEHGEETHGVFLYDSTMHIPLILAGPDIPGGRTVHQQVRSIDVLPTLLDCLGLPPAERVQGTSLLPAVTGDEEVRTHYSYMETLYPKTHMGWSELRGLRTDEWKLIVAPRPELYRLSTDTLEEHNVIEQHPGAADGLQKRVWEIAGPLENGETVEPQAIDEETRQRLQSLGYVSAGSSRPIRMDLSGPDPKERVQILRALDRATDLMNHDRFSAAVPLLREAVAQDSRNPLLYQHLGVCYQELKDFQKAEAIYLQAIQNQADTDRTYAELGELSIRAGELEEAVLYLETAVGRNPTALDVFQNLANAWLQLGNTREAEKAVQAILSQKPSHGAGNNLMGLIEVGRGNAPVAKVHFERAIAARPELAEPYLNLGLLAQQAGRPGEALRYFRLFLEKAVDPQYHDIIPRVRAAVQELEK